MGTRRILRGACALFAATLLLAACAGRNRMTHAFPCEPSVRVRILYTLAEVRATSQSPLEVLDAGGSHMATLAPSSAVRIVVREGNVVIEEDGGLALAQAPMVSLSDRGQPGRLDVEKVPYGIGWWWESAENRSYEGRYEIRVNEQGHLEVILEAPLEEYLRGVVPQEIGGDSPGEALKAQAVAARSETADALLTRKYAAANYDICADVECQAYAGIGKASAATDAAIRATRGEVLFAAGRPIAAYFASNCGGVSENIENVWPARSGPVEHFSGHPDDDGALAPVLANDEAVRDWLAASPEVYCNPGFSTGLPQWAQRNFRWERRFTADEVTQRVALKKDIGRVVAIRTGARGVSGRLLDATFVGEAGEVRVGFELPIRQVFDPPLRSACFVVDTDGPAGKPDSFVIRGAGWGHGVGMCQTGAIGRAHAGADYRAILAQYYRGAEVRAAYPIVSEE